MLGNHFILCRQTHKDALIVGIGFFNLSVPHQSPSSHSTPYKRNSTYICEYGSPYIACVL